MATALKYQIAAKIFLVLTVVHFILFNVPLQILHYNPKCGDTCIYSFVALASGFWFCLTVCALLSMLGADTEQPATDRSTQIELQSFNRRTQPHREWPYKTHRSSQSRPERAEHGRVLLPLRQERLQTDRRSQFQLERADHGRLLPDFYQTARLVFASLHILPPLESYKRNNETEASKDECAICLEEFRTGELVQPFPKCNHLFHASCLNSWLLGGKIICPMSCCSL